MNRKKNFNYIAKNIHYINYDKFSKLDAYKTNQAMKFTIDLIMSIQPIYIYISKYSFFNGHIQIYVLYYKHGMH